MNTKSNMSDRHIGTDAYTFEMICEENIQYMPKTKLVSELGREYGFIQVSNGKATLVIILSKYLRDNNILPFSLNDVNYLNEILEYTLNRINEILGKVNSITLNKVECNITQPVAESAKTSDVLNLLCKSHLSSEKDVMKFVGPSKESRTKESIHTVIYKKEHYYILKAYDKSEQQRKLRNNNKDTIPDKYLRIEIVMLDRTLKSIFGEDLSIENILTFISLKNIILNFSEILKKRIIEEHIILYLNDCKSDLVKALSLSYDRALTVLQEKELICDAEVLKKALKELYKIRNNANNSSRDTNKFVSKYNLPVDVIKTIKEFKITSNKIHH